MVKKVAFLFEEILCLTYTKLTEVYANLG